MSVATIAELATVGELLVALDFDGTLAPRQDDPMAARMLPGARAAVDALARLPRTTVALVSGRSLGDLEEISEHTADSPIHLAASHGAEFWHPGDPDAAPAPSPESIAERDRVRGDAERAVEDLADVWIEPKTFGFAVHTRQAGAAETAEAHARVERLMAGEEPHWRRRTGHDILEYASRQEGKDTAVAELRRLTHADAVLFAGDDVTDEDALASLGPADLGVHVGDGDTAASVSVPRIEDLADLLAELARQRARAVGARE
ncbi:trehalose-phosphatase [Microbacterium sp. SORGH_AS_0888]|uniref:trehalose-phosphatase n=1 Tax=Microbacterium sp. SORGH_AS_0888 TaxID=3041791 RepID=UPI00278AB43E|nr:trehalose-phosphatase [Microbacterium sp. SORGH_AS_0888]MDQ1128310.1 trehalose 6-phosphate phosphatase [Microbacterium sp. SORGH_AS_0888]